MTGLAIAELCIICVLIGFYFLEKAFKAARHYDPQPREAKKIIVKVGDKKVLITTRGGEQC